MTRHTNQRNRTERKSAAALLALVVLAGCESERTIDLRQSNGSTAPTAVSCVGVGGKGKVAGVDYDWSARNTIVGVLTGELFLIPPVMVLHHEFFCPIGDTTKGARSLPR